MEKQTLREKNAKFLAVAERCFGAGIKQFPAHKRWYICIDMDGLDEIATAIALTGGQLVVVQSIWVRGCRTQRGTTAFT